MPRSSRVVMTTLCLLPLLAVSAGGWATITVEDLPDHVVVRQPVSLTFTVRQHGNHRLAGLRPWVEAAAGELRARAAAAPAGANGRYRASLTLPEPGEWTVTILGGFHDARVTLVPLAAVAPGAGSRPRLTEAERGRRLFVAKGCVTCHVHAEVGGGNLSLPVGPELTGKRYAADYLRLFLDNPAIKPPTRPGVTMPRLDLKPTEIASLAAFINAERQALR